VCKHLVSVFSYSVFILTDGRE